jgi:hypothetical protein
MIKSHLAPPFLPEQIWNVKPKLIHVSRNIKDVALSGYHMLTSFMGIPLELDQYLDAFLNAGLVYCPFVAHTELCWDLEGQGFSNILYLNYDEMMMDVEATIKKVQKFLGNSYSDEQIKLLKEHLSFQNMKSMHTCTGVQSKSNAYHIADNYIHIYTMYIYKVQNQIHLYTF